MKKRIFSCVVLISILLSFIPGIVTNAEEQFSIVYIDENFENGMPDSAVIEEGMSEIGIETTGDNSKLAMKTDYDGIVGTIKWNIDDVCTGKLEALVDFEQISVKTENNSPLILLNGSKEIVRISATSNDLVVSNGNESNVLLANYEADTTYSLKVVADFSAMKFDVYVNGEKKIADVELMENTITAFASKIESAPGILLDNVYVQNTVGVTGLSVIGEEQISIPKQGEREYNYKIVYTDNSGVNVNFNDFEVQLSGNTTGINYELSGDEIKLLIGTTAAAGNIVINVNVKDHQNINGTITVTLVEGNASIVKITGDAHVSANGEKPFQYIYKAKAFDAFGNEMYGEEFYWEVSENLTGASLEIYNDGTLVVSGNMPAKDMYATIRATMQSDSNVYGEKYIVVQKYETYLSDMYRLQAVKDSIDFILNNASSKVNQNPLVAAYLSPYTKMPGKVQYVNTGAVAYSDLSTNFELHRAMVGLSNMLDDESYRERVLDMYQWYLDYGLTKDELFLMGNHRVFDLDTGRLTEQNEKYDTDIPYMEIEDRDFYSEPFVELDSEQYVRFCQAFWANCIQDWSTLVFNRHTIINNRPTDFSVLERLDRFDETAQDGEFKYIPFIGLTFMSTGNILIKTASDAYLYGDPDDIKNQNLKIWGYNFIRRFLNTKHKDTDMFGTMFVSSLYSEGRGDLEATYGERWWETEEGAKAGAQYSFGDRAYNQFAQTCVDNGLITEEQMPEILEGAMISGDRIFGRFAWECFEYADKVMGLETEEGKGIVVDYTKCIKSIIEHAYDTSTNKFDTIFTNGVDISDMKWKRPGYWGKAGNTFGQWDLTEASLLTMVKAYETSSVYPELQEEREYIWEFLKTYLDKKYSIGDIGNPLENIPPKFNKNISCKSTGLVRLLVSFYEETGYEDYLNLARIIGNNIVNKTFKYNMFISDNKLRYITTEAESQYVLLLIEQAIRKEDNLLPKSSYSNAYEYQLDSYSMVNSAFLDWTNPELLSWKYRDVQVNKIIPDVEELHLNVGETATINLTIKPDDASSKSVFWEIANKNIVSINEQNKVFALNKGETTVIAVSKSTKGVDTKPIKVIVK